MNFKIVFVAVYIDYQATGLSSNLAIKITIRSEKRLANVPHLTTVY